MIQLLVILFFGVPASAGDLSLISIPQKETLAYTNHQLLLTVTARSEAGLPLEYIWKKDGRVLEGQTKSVLIVKTPSKKDVGTYSVTVKNSLEEKEAKTSVKLSKTKLKREFTSEPVAPVAGGCHEMAPEHHHH